MRSSLLNLTAALLGTLMLWPGASSAQPPQLSEAWRQNGFAVARFEINGTEGRNNPLRRALQTPFAGEELFVRYRLRYDAATIDTPGEDEGEFFVLWLDESEGSDASTHSGGVPNVGLHVSGEENRFMVRYAAGGEKFGPPLVGDRDFLIVARLWKSNPGDDQPFDQLDLWVDPRPDQEFSPAASAKDGNAISQTSWIGFSTGAKTEFDDKIEVWDIGLSDTWAGILGLTPQQATSMMSPPPPAEPTIAFAQHVLPILESKCFACHAGEEPESGVRLDVWDEVLNQTAPRDAEASRLIQVVAEGEMPPEGDPLTAKQIATLRTWIDEGLVWDEDRLPTPVPVSQHWAFQPIRRPEIPSVANSDWVRTPVDAFIAIKHEQAGLTPAPEANRETLRRRIALDLTGLPPSFHSSHHAPRDEPIASTDAIASTDVETQPNGAHHAERDGYIDELLASRAYGERWGRHWLDVARWAESNGHQHNRDRPHAWRYRDWVVDAFRSDKPYDAFVREQIAGDELSPPTTEHLVATGFLAAARYSGNELDKDIQRNDILVDITNTTASAFLGLTLECAQCHSHKFDPLSLRDYYSFLAFFVKGQPGNVVFTDDEPAREVVRERRELFDAAHQRLLRIRRRQGHPEPILLTPENVVGGMTKAERGRYNDLTEQLTQLPQSWGFYSPATASRSWSVAPHEMRWPLPDDPKLLAGLEASLLIRGDVKSRGPDVTPAWPALFGRTPDEMQHPRRQLADWLTSPGNPLTARVWVNRIWQWHFGRGLVESASDFGTQGSSPSHPELLDYLASELIDNGWSTHHIHRLILESATYRQSSQYHAGNADIDPENRLLWRWTPRRLEAEAIRDSILAVAGLLDTSAGGPGDGGDSLRRSLYLHQKRDDLPDQQMLFDSAGGIVSCSRRRVSTTALQPLWLLNSEFVQTAAAALAERTGAIDEAFRVALGRDPTTDELTELATLAKDHGPASACLAILNASEFLYLP